VFDFGALEEAQAAIDAIGDAGIKQRVFDHAGLRVRAVQHGDLAPGHALADEVLHLLDHPGGFQSVGAGLEHAQLFAFACVGPEVLAQPPCVVADQRVGGVEDVAVRAIVLLELDQVADAELALEVGHVADVGAAKRVDRLIVVADRKHRRTATRQQLEPAVLQGVGVLELIDQDVAEPALVVLAHRLVALEQFVTAQQQLGEIDHALALALRVVQRIELDHPAVVVITDLHLAGAKARFLGAVDELLHVARRVLLVIDPTSLEQPLDRGELIGRVQDLEGLR
jgi:hypothetical protein